MSDKMLWEGRIISVQPRIRLLRSFDERSHSYLGYSLLIEGRISGREAQFRIGIGKAAQAKNQFRARDTPKQSTLESLLDAIKYFEDNKERMHYDRYRKLKLPIGSGTVESACKNVIGGRLKSGGMTWSPSGAEGMLQIRSSVESGRFYSDFKRTLRMAS